MIESAEGRHGGIEGLLAGMAEGRMAQVVGQRHRLGQILVQCQATGDGTGDLGDLDAVGEPRAVMISLVKDEDLGLVLQAAKGCGMKDSIAIALKDGAHRALRLGLETAAALLRPAGIGGKGRHRPDSIGWPGV